MRHLQVFFQIHATSFYYIIILSFCNINHIPKKRTVKILTYIQYIVILHTHYDVSLPLSVA